jgi:hypothetical protein
MEKKISMIGLCGDNCEYCPRYVATQDGRIEELEKTKELWVRLGLRTPDFPVKDMICHGCKPENKCAYPKLRACVITKTYDNCGFCDEYPCEITQNTFDQSERLRGRVENICTQTEKDTLQKVFFSKKENFDRIDQERRRKMK